MVITLSPELEAVLTELARRQGTSPEALVLNTLRDKFLPAAAPPGPQDEWERRLLALAKDCGLSLSDAALGREALYE
jgi:hypothetical protein